MQVAYFLWRYPVLSQTFIQREVAALREAGVHVLVVAEGHGEPETMDTGARALCGTTVYIGLRRVGLLARHLFFGVTMAPRRAVVALAALARREAGPTLYGRLVLYLKAMVLTGVLREHGVRHIHAPWANESAFVASLAARLLGITYSVQVRAYELWRSDSTRRLPATLAPARFVITNSAYNSAQIRRLLPPSDWTKLHTIYNGLPLETFPPRHARADAAEPPRLLAVGRLIEQKGYLHLLRSCHVLRERGYRFRCDIVGGPVVEVDDGYHASLLRLHNELALEDTVVFRGSLPFSHVLEHYLAADVFVLPCVTAADGARDITPNALIEAMAMSLPVVSTLGTALDEIVEQGQSGFLVPRGDEIALADAIASLIDDPDLGRRLGRNARARVEDRFDIKKNVQAYVELFHSVGAMIEYNETLATLH